MIVSVIELELIAAYELSSKVNKDPMSSMLWT